MPSKKSTSRSRSYRSRQRSLRLEQLEDRRLLAIDWRNPLDNLDVNNDEFVSPIDALIVINDLNSDGSRPLTTPRGNEDDFIDVNGDRFVSPIDVLLVINTLNRHDESERLAGVTTLSESGPLVTEKIYSVPLQPSEGRTSYSIDVAPNWSGGDTGAGSQDLLSVYVVDPSDWSSKILDGGEPGSAVFSLTSNSSDITPGVSRWDGSRLEIDLTTVSESFGEVYVVAQLLNGDDALGTGVTLSPIGLTVDESAETISGVSMVELALDPGSPVNTSALQGSPDARLELTDVAFDSTLGTYAASLRLHTGEQAVGSQAVAVITNLPEDVTVTNASGLTPEGLPYINLSNAIPPGGVGQNSRSSLVRLEISNPNCSAFHLQPELLVGEPNRAPEFPAIPPITVRPGASVTVPLTATDPDGDPITYSWTPDDQMPTSALAANGSVLVNPTPTEVGNYDVMLHATDGQLRTSQTLSVIVEADPVTTTRITGSVLDTNSVPLVGVPIELGDVSTTTDQDGRFRLETATAFTSDALLIRGEAIAGDEVYPFIAEKLHLLFGRGLYENVENVIDRPIYLPVLDVAGGTEVDPSTDTNVVVSLAGDEAAAEVFVASGTLSDQAGNPFDGILSITEVPAERTPAALPANLLPDVVVTIQPGEMAFSTPAPLTLPNRAGYAAGDVMDLWSINPMTGDFDNVGVGRVSEDASVIFTESGGIMNSSWHFFARPADPPGDDDRNPDPRCVECEDGIFATSTVLSHSGVLMEEHALPTYQSLGQARGVRFVYDSLRADPRPIVHVGASDVVGGAGVLAATARVTNRLIGGGAFGSATLPSWSMDLPGVSSGGIENGNFWKVPGSSNQLVDASGALQADLTGVLSGEYLFVSRAGVVLLNDVGNAGSLSTGVVPILHVNSRSSAVGSGWGIAGLQELIINPQSAMLVDGDGSELSFRFERVPTFSNPTYEFVSPPGDFSELTHSIELVDGEEVQRFTRRTKDGTEYVFEGPSLPGVGRAIYKLVSMSDRNGNQTAYSYDASGNLTLITDPVGLETTFNYSDQMLSSVTDPAGRVTELSHDSNGNLISIVDADSTSRQFSYDSGHRLVVEVDKRGFSESVEYDFAGRVRSVVRRDGSTMQFRPAQTQVLYAPEATISLENLPEASTSTDAVARHVDANGNITVVTLDQQGQSIAKRDSVGLVGVTRRNEENLVTSHTNGRGFVTEYTYDELGNVTSIADEVSGGVLKDAVRWIGTDGDWNEPTNWSAGRVPGAADSVVIDVPNAELTITHGSGATTVRRLVVAEALTLNGGSINVTATSSVSGDLVVSPGATLRSTGTLFSATGNTFASGGRFESFEGGVIRIPNLQEFRNGRIHVDGPGEVIALGTIDATGSQFESLQGGVIRLPNLEVFRNGRILVDGPGEIQANGLTNIDLARFVIRNGGTFRLPASVTTYDTSARLGVLERRVLLSVDGEGSVLDFSSLNSMRSLFDGLGQLQQIVEVKDGGFIDLSSLKRITAGGGGTDGGPFVFKMNDGGAIDLSAIENFDGRAGGIDVLLPSQQDSSFPELLNASRTEFSIPQETELSFPKLQTFSLADITVPSQSLLSAPSLTELENTTIRIDGAGEFQTGTLTSIDCSRFLLTNGATYVLPETVESYDSSCGHGTNEQRTILSAVGEGSRLDFSKLKTLYSQFNGLGSIKQIVRAGEGASVDLSSVTSITGGGDGLDGTGRKMLEFRADEAGVIDLSGLTEFNGIKGGIRFDVSGTLHLNDGGTTISAASLSSATLQSRASGVTTGTLGPISSRVAVSGSGQLDLGITNSEGTVENLTGTESLTLNGNYVQGADAKLAIQLSDASPAKGAVVVSGSATFDGTLEITFDNSFQPATGDRFTIVSFDSSTGEFSNVIGLDARSGLELALRQHETFVEIEVVSVGGGGEGEFSHPPMSGLRNVFYGPVLPDDFDARESSLPITPSKNLEVWPPKRTIAEGESGASAAQPREFTYENRFSQMTSMTDELGRETLMEIDPTNGNLLKTTRVVGLLDSAQNGETDDLVTTFTYTPAGLTDTVTDPLGRLTDYDYDAFGRLTKTTFAKGTFDEAEVRFGYDAAGNQTDRWDENGNHTQFEYDELNRLKKVLQPDPDGDGPLVMPESIFVYDENGNLTESTDAEGSTTVRNYDALDRVFEEIAADPDGTGPRESPITSFEYDNLGKVTRQIDPLGNASRMEYDARSRQTRSVDPDGGTTQFTYDLTDNLESLTDPVNNSTAFAYDARDRLIVETDPLGHSTNYDYDAVDNLTRKTDRLDRVTEFWYDNLNRLVEENWLASSTDATLANEINYEYDKADNLLVVEDYFSKLTHAYDNRDRVLTVDNAGTPDAPEVLLSYAYDAVGNVASVTDTLENGDTSTTAYGFDALNRTTVITQSGDNVSDKRVEFAYNQLGQYESIDRYSDLVGTQLVVATDYAYDDLNRLKDLEHANSSDELLAFYRYSYDTDSRITQIIDIDGTTDYSYDDRDQLVGADRADDDVRGDESYRYDANGSRLESHLHGDAYRTESANRLSTDGIYTYEYDDEGNMIRKAEIVSGIVREFQWDHRNRLVRISDMNEEGTILMEADYIYDAFDRRIRKSVSTDSVHSGTELLESFVYDRHQLLLEYADEDGSANAEDLALKRRNLFGPRIDEILAQENRILVQSRWLLADHLGTIREDVNDDGGILNQIRFDSFGRLVGRKDFMGETRFGFTGRDFDVESGYYFFRARYLNSESGFLTEDPVRFATRDWNLRAYVSNSPISLRDFSGRTPAHAGAIAVAICSRFPALCTAAAAECAMEASGSFVGELSGTSLPPQGGSTTFGLMCGIAGTGVGKGCKKLRQLFPMEPAGPIPSNFPPQPPSPTPAVPGGADLDPKPIPLPAPKRNRGSI